MVLSGGTIAGDAELRGNREGRVAQVLGPDRDFDDLIEPRGAGGSAGLDPDDVEGPGHDGLENVPFGVWDIDLDLRRRPRLAELPAFRAR